MPLSRANSRQPTRRAAALSVGVLQKRRRDQFLVAVASVAVAIALCVPFLSKLTGSLLIVLPVLFVLPAILAWLWRSPVRGVYVLLAAAELLEVIPGDPIDYPDDYTRYLPFFADFATWTHVHGLSFSLNEIFLVLMLLIWLLKGIADRNLHFDKGSLMLPMGLYMLMILVGEAHGLSSGGNQTTSLWEVRGQVYMLVAYLLTCNLVKTRKHMNVLVWIIILAAGFRGIFALNRYYIILHHSLGGREALFPHEQSFFWNAFLTLTPILFLYGGSRRLKRVALLFLPAVVVANLANDRRAAILALAVALFGLVIITMVAYLPRRRMMVTIVIALAVVLPPYYLLYQNKTGGIAFAAHAIASAFHPDPRDAASNLYRIDEDKDIMATMQLSPIIGYGFGKPMITPYVLPDISKFYIFWNILPHDSILWVWMRMGTIGYILLWVLIGTSMIQATALIRRLRDPALKGLAVFIVLMVIQEVILGRLDLQWTNYRNLITMGVLFALIGRLAVFARADERDEPRRRLARHQRLALPIDLAVVDGRLARTARPLAVVPGSRHDDSDHSPPSGA